MASVQTQIRIDNETKLKATKIFKTLGLDLSTAVNIFLRKCIFYNGIPFEIKLDEPNEVTYKAIKNAENDEDIYGPFENVSDLMDELNA